MCWVLEAVNTALNKPTRHRGVSISWHYPVVAQLLVRSHQGSWNSAAGFACPALAPLFLAALCGLQNASDFIFSERYCCAPMAGGTAGHLQEPSMANSLEAKALA